MNFWSHVTFSSELGPQVATTVSALDGGGKAEISDLQVKVLVKEHVLRLQITVSYSFLMDVVKSFNQLLEVKS